MRRLIGRHCTISGGSTTTGTLGTNLSVRVMDAYCLACLGRLIRRKGMGRDILSSTMQHVLRGGCRLKLFRSPFHCYGPRETTEVLGTPRIHGTSLHVTRHSIMLLRGERSILPLATRAEGVTLVKKLSGSRCSVTNT